MAINPEYGLLTGEQAVQRGLTQAGGLMASYVPSPYPSYVPSQKSAPTQLDYMNYMPNAPMAQVQTPNYQLNLATPTWQQFTPQKGGGYPSVNTQVQTAPWNYQGINANAQTAPFSFQNYGIAAPTYQGLMGGDYEALQKALMTPGELAAGTAYQQGQTNLQNQMGGRGLYGSSIMANQARNALETPYMNALATNAANAAAQRYAMQQSDLANASSQQMAGWQTGMNQSLAGNQANLNYAGLVTGVNQQNVANQYAQAQQANLLGQNYAQLQTQTAADSASRALQQQQAMNALQSGDMQAYNALMSQQGLAKNQFAQQTYAQQMEQNQSMNIYNQQKAQLGMGQAQNVWQAGVSDAARQQEYNREAMEYANLGTEQQRQWENQQALEQMQYQLASGHYTNEQQTAMMNQYLALAGKGQVTSSQSVAKEQAQAAQQSALYGNLGGLLTTGGLLYGGSQGWF